ncbi:MAG: fibronectin type III domain-containing protein [Dysgonamonadaceae bacterium]|jgi:hypothetical protein|nr:fibronectin type III domain-containing protein [Dysgonamonadaceae bacterium]
MNKKLIRWLLAVLPFLVCTGCEYELQETNYVEIDKPQEMNCKVEILAPLNENGEYVIKYELLRFSLELPENVDYVRFELYRENDDYYYTSYGVNKTTNYISLWVNPGKYILKGIIPSSRTGTGSLADVSGYEYYEKSFEWKLVIQQNATPNLNLRYERLSETTFKLLWDTPDPDYGEVSYYNISYWYDYQLGNTNETSYIVTLPQGNNREYYVRAYFKDYYQSPLESSIYIYNY